MGKNMDKGCWVPDAWWAKVRRNAQGKGDGDLPDFMGIAILAYLRNAPHGDDGFVHVSYRDIAFQFHVSKMMAKKACDRLVAGGYILREFRSAPYGVAHERHITYNDMYLKGIIDEGAE